jgi:hypothetical protein
MPRDHGQCLDLLLVSPNPRVEPKTARQPTLHRRLTRWKKDRLSSAGPVFGIESSAVSGRYIEHVAKADTESAHIS